MATAFDGLMTPVQVEIDRLRDEERLISDQLKTKRQERERAEAVLALMQGKTGYRRRRNGAPANRDKHVSQARLDEVKAIMAQMDHPASIREISEYVGKSTTWAGDAITVLSQKGEVVVDRTAGHPKTGVPTRYWKLATDQAPASEEFASTRR